VVTCRVLGPVEIELDGQPIDLGRPRQRCVLAVLLVEPNTVVPVEALVDRVWGEDPPRAVRNALHAHLARLRRALAGSPEIRVVRRSGGYLVEVDAESVDLHRFRRLVAAARSVNDEQASAWLEQALALWRGTALTGITGSWAEGFRTSLDGEWLATVLERNAADLRRGRHVELLAELRRLLAAHPLHERLAAQLMLATYRAGSQAEALQVFHNIRGVLIEELGIEPGEELQHLYQRILTGDAALAAPTAHRGASLHYLPRDIDDFTGREAELDRLVMSLPAVDDTPPAVVITAVDGMAGIGKTALAIHAAHQLSHRYPDGHLFLDLHGHSGDHDPLDPAAALETLLRALGVPAEKIPHGLTERAGLWRAELANCKAMVVLDNAADATQIRPLLPANPHCLVLITSRRRLTDLESAYTLSLDVMPPSDARALFTRIVGDDRVTAEPEAVDEVLRLCGLLPLAIRIAAARLRARPAWTIAHLAQRLRQQQRRLNELAVGDRSMTAAFRLSYHHLGPDQQRIFRLLGLHPGTYFDAHQAAALADLSLEQADQHLEDLVEVHLLQQPRAERYRFHDLLRAYAAQLTTETDTDTTRQAAQHRLLDHYLHTASVAMYTILPHERTVRPSIPASPTPTPNVTDYEQAQAWLKTERTNLLAIMHTAVRHGGPARTSHLSTTFGRYLDICGYYDNALTLHTDTLTLCQHTGNRLLEAHALHGLGLTHYRLAQYEQALAYYQQALKVLRQVGNRNGEGHVLHGMGLVNEQLGRYEQARIDYEQALTIARGTGSRYLEAHVLLGLGFIAWRVGHYQPALAHLHQTLTITRTFQIPSPYVESHTLAALGCVSQRLGHHEQARTHLEQALTLARRTGDRALQGQALDDLGAADLRTGRFPQALTHLHQALELARDIGDRTLEAHILANLGLTHGQMGHHDQAHTHLQAALTICRQTGTRHLEAEVLNSLGDIIRLLGDPNQAITHHKQALTLAAEIGDRDQQARAHHGLAHAHHSLANPHEAHHHNQQALAIYTHLAVPEAHQIQGHLNNDNNHS
jgi:DNA-binding SARP family transcriptional activator/Flp pilus assembly protein TadD